VTRGRAEDAPLAHNQGYAGSIPAPATTRPRMHGIHVDDETHARLKAHCKDRGWSMKRFVESLIHQASEKGHIPGDVPRFRRQRR